MKFETKHVEPVKGKPFREVIFAEILKTLNPGTLVDLGAGHCTFSVIARDLGFKVTAVDARTVRVPADLPYDIDFIESNVLDVNLEKYDVICILGLLYHLTLSEQIELLGKCKNKIVIIDTHLAEKPVVQLDAYLGQYYQEAQTTEKLLKNPKAAFTTLQSFWHTYQSFYKLIENSGFGEIIIVKPEHYPYRTFFICKP